MSWEKWHEQHPYEAHPRERSADKLAESIKSSLGHDATKGGVRKREGGVVGRAVQGRAVVSRAPGSKSVVSTPGKKDFKRAAPVKGEKDRADSQRTKIRMAAYNRSKKGETAEVGNIKPEGGNTGKIRSADKLVASREDRYAAARKEATAASAKAEKEGTPEAHRAASAAHTGAGNLSPDDLKQRSHDRQASNHRYEAKQLEAQARPAAQHEERQTAEAAKAESKSTAGPARVTRPAKKSTGGSIEHKSTADTAAKRLVEDRDARTQSHYEKVADRAAQASRDAKDEAGHTEAYRQHMHAANVAPTEELRQTHMKLAVSHDRANVYERGVAQRAASLNAAKTRAGQDTTPFKTTAAEQKARADKTRADYLKAQEEKSAGKSDAARNHYNMVAGRARLASETAKTSGEHQAAAKANRRAAELAPGGKERTLHENLATSHDKSADLESKHEAGRLAAAKAQEQAARERAAKTAADNEAARQRVAQRSADKLAAQVAKPKALTGQNVHKTLESIGLERTPKSPASRDHRGRVVQTPSGRTLGKYDVSKNYDGSYRVDVYGGGGGSYGPSERDKARHQENIDKATEAFKSSGWDVRPGSTGMRGHLEVSPRSAEGKAPAAPAATRPEVGSKRPGDPRFYPPKDAAVAETKPYDRYSPGMVNNPFMGSVPHYSLANAYHSELDLKNNKMPQTVTPAEARKYLPLEHVDPRSLVHTQPWMRADPLDNSVGGKRSAKNSDVIAYRNAQGQMFIQDGHHRVAQAVRDGKTTVPVRVYDSEHVVPKGSAKVSAPTAAKAADQSIPKNRTPSEYSLKRASNRISGNLSPEKRQEAVNELARHLDLLPASATNGLEVRVVPDISKYTGVASDKHSTGLAKVEGDKKIVYIKSSVATAAGDKSERAAVHSGHLVSGGDSALQSTLAHEIGHHVHVASGIPGTNGLVLRQHEAPSGYGKQDMMEHAAEAYAHYYMTGKGHGSQIVDRAHGR